MFNLNTDDALTFRLFLQADVEGQLVVGGAAGETGQVLNHGFRVSRAMHDVPDTLRSFIPTLLGLGASLGPSLYPSLSGVPSIF